MEIKDKEILILGEGISGMGAFDALEGVAARLFYYDGCLNKIRPDLIVVSPGIAAHPALDFAAQNNIPVISELELGYLLNRSPIVAVTGTNGKTTVTRMIGEMADTLHKTIVCGNIGVAFSSAARKPHKLAVVEVSSFQLLCCHKFAPEIAVITNITPDHLDRHGSMDNYIAAKMRITKNQTADDFLICPLSLRPQLKQSRARVLFADADIAEKNGEIWFLGQPVAALPPALAQAHNRQNAMCSVGAAKLLGVDDAAIADVLASFRQEPHRLQLVSTAFGKHWFDDSKATNIGSCLAACSSMTGSTALLLGGSDKGYEYDELFQNLPDSMTKIYVFGAVKKKLLAAAERTSKEVSAAENLLDAVTMAASDDVQNVLLSPAAASFDNFQNYAQRGKAFVDAISEMERNS